MRPFAQITNTLCPRAMFSIHERVQRRNDIEGTGQFFELQQPGISLISLPLVGAIRSAIKITDGNAPNALLVFGLKSRVPDYGRRGILASFWNLEGDYGHRAICSLLRS